MVLVSITSMKICVNSVLIFISKCE
jgi:hypothetical protein